MPSLPVDFLLGAAVILSPKAPVLLGAAAVGVVRGVLRGRRRARQEAGEGEHPPSLNGNAPGPSEVRLAWRDLACTLPAGRKRPQRDILRGVSGDAHPGRLLAIMGPSGGGKTTLLNALAGQVPATKGMRLTGRITLNGQAQGESAVQQAYVQQEDVFYSQLTVRETLSMAAALRLPPSTGRAQREARVDALIKQLGLTQAEDTVVGDEKVRGISGGERKRLSIGCELISRPLLLFADEPTTGLDSAGALQVMRTLGRLAGEGKTVVASIHQPRSAIFELFDDLLLLAGGRPVYFGPAAGAVAHFERQGFKCPPNYNPAEYLADLISIDNSSPEAEASSSLGLEIRDELRRERLDKLLGAFRPSAPAAPLGPPPRTSNGADAASSQPSANGASSRAAGDSDTDSHVGSQHAPRSAWQGAAQHAQRWGRQAKLLYGRSWRQISRDRATAVARAGSNVASAIIFGAIYWRLGLRQTAIQDRMGLLQVSAVNAAMSSLVKTLNVFPKERAIVERERAKAAYDVGPYFLSKLAAESPVGALFPLLFSALVYPAAGLHPKWARFGRFCGLVTLESFASTALGLSVGAAAPSADAALAIGPGIMVLFIVFGGYYVNAETVPAIFRWLPRTSLIKNAFEGLCLNEFRGLRFEAGLLGGEGDVRDGGRALARVGFERGSIAHTVQAQARILAFNYWATYCLLKARRPRFQPLEAPPA